MSKPHSGEAMSQLAGGLYLNLPHFSSGGHLNHPVRLVTIKHGTEHVEPLHEKAEENHRLGDFPNLNRADLIGSDDTVYVGLRPSCFLCPSCFLFVTKPPCICTPPQLIWWEGVIPQP